MKIILIAALIITILFVFSLEKMSKISDEKLEELWGKRDDFDECINKFYYGGKGEACFSCEHAKGENNLICTCVDSDNNTDFVARGMKCEHYKRK